MPEQRFTDPAATARAALACLDLTRLNDGDTEADIEHLCERAQGRYGPVAAVCVLSVVSSDIVKLLVVVECQPAAHGIPGRPRFKKSAPAPKSAFCTISDSPTTSMPGKMTT